jgi:hypothetical protein
MTNNMTTAWQMPNAPNDSAMTKTDTDVTNMQQDDNKMTTHGKHPMDTIQENDKTMAKLHQS